MLGSCEETEIEDNIDIPYVVDETVKVTDGPFSGFSGIIEEVNVEKRKKVMTMKNFTIENKDDINSAIDGLGKFCHSFCMNSPNR